MSQTIARSTVFLDEMGVGVQWKLRNPPVGEEAAVEYDVAEEPVAVVAEAPPAPVPAPVPVAVSAPTPAPAPAPVVAPVPTPAPSFNPEPPAEEVEFAAADEDSTAWFDEAPVPARAEPVGDAAIAAMDWPALKTAVSTCTRCALCDTRRNAVNGRGAADASWFAIAAAPSRLDEKENQVIAGEAGQLLDNMLKAISLKPEADVYVTSLVKCRPSGPDGADRAPSGEELLACRPFLERELALTGATMAMTFGQHAAKGLMMGPATRGQVMRYGAAQLPVVATYHPDDLLRKPEDKAKAWGDLCLAKAARD
ncbi:uracil-DNA glycosylase [Duganella violaceipulchra]|uniref:DNA polymerase n=1 Tax=Duganella violaceipulchra TaxID=2849652 RepID=A0AA41HF88_9BURK|nr:uracil-DNA glycosylase [Duganella violaceicalia]MBV6323031.1 uracil-DNA glycosylase [Duganella violaceicalia]MCP2010183.1 DNA polymerase [Duganella violaceicalia]